MVKNQFSRSQLATHQMQSLCAPCAFWSEPWALREAWAVVRWACLGQPLVRFRSQTGLGSEWSHGRCIRHPRRSEFPQSQPSQQPPRYHPLAEIPHMPLDNSSTTPPSLLATTTAAVTLSPTKKGSKPPVFIPRHGSAAGAQLRTEPRVGATGTASVPRFGPLLQSQPTSPSPLPTPSCEQSPTTTHLPQPFPTAASSHDCFIAYITDLFRSPRDPVPLFARSPAYHSPLRSPARHTSATPRDAGLNCPAGQCGPDTRWRPGWALGRPKDREAPVAAHRRHHIRHCRGQRLRPG